jgi:selT/selW/selH-like putative selenoprotein
VDADIAPGQKGQFDVVVDGDVIFSKWDTGRFPEEDEILDRLG